MEFGHHALYHQKTCLNASIMSSIIPCKGIKTALASATPEEGIEREPSCCCRAISRTRCLSDGVAKENSFWIENKRQLIRIPQRIEFCNIGYIKVLLLKTQEIDEKF